jgi:hypothetical protein
MEYKEPIGIYPKLRTARDGEVHIIGGSAYSYRWQKVSDILKEIEQECKKEKYAVKSMIEVWK